MALERRPSSRGRPSAGARLALDLRPGGGGLELGPVRPLARDGAGALLPLQGEVGGEGGLRVVEVPPAVAPDLAAVSPAVGVAGEQELEALGEAGLAGAVAADDEGEAGAGGEVEGGLRADAAEAFDGDGFRGRRCGGWRALRGAGRGRRIPRRLRRLGMTGRRARGDRGFAASGPSSSSSLASSSGPSRAARTRADHSSSGLVSASRRFRTRSRRVVSDIQLPRPARRLRAPRHPSQPTGLGVTRPGPRGVGLTRRTGLPGAFPARRGLRGRQGRGPTIRPRAWCRRQGASGRGREGWCQTFALPRSDLPCPASAVPSGH